MFEGIVYYIIYIILLVNDKIRVFFLLLFLYFDIFYRGLFGEYKVCSIDFKVGGKGLLKKIFIIKKRKFVIYDIFDFILNFKLLRVME